MLFHRCDRLFYTRQQAAYHLHALHPLQCISGWRAATEKEYAQAPEQALETPSTLGKPTTEEKS
jgi:hypothetical protein